MVKDNKEILQEMVKDNKEMVKDNKEMKSLLSNVLDTDCYDKISETSSSRNFTKADFAQHLNVPTETLQCMVSELKPPSNQLLILAHILPRSADFKTKELLAIGDVDCPRNFLILCKGIERAYDSKAISFVPADNPFEPNRYILKIWSSAVKNQRIYEGAAQTIGHYEGFPLNLRVGNAAHNPYKRLLSYQAYRAFVKWQSFYKLPVAEFPLDCDISEYVGNYKETRANYVENLARAIAAEEDDEADG